MNLEAFPTDPDLPQLKIATDPVLMREVFRGYLRQLPGRAYYVQDCLLSWVRYFRSARCTLQYTLRLVEPRTGDERTQWLTGVIDADGRSERIWQKLRFTSLEQEIPEGLLTFEPVSFISDLRILVQVFPFDRRLPALPILMAGPSPDLERLLLTRFGPGDWQAEAWNIEPIRYRVGARAVLQYAVQARDAATGRRGEKRFYVKVYRDEEGERTYQALQTLWRRSEARGDSFTVEMPIAYLSSLHTLLQGEATGTSLEQLLLQGRDMVAAVRKAVRALAVLNQDNVATMRRHSQEDEISDLKSEGNILRWACPQLAAEVDRIIGTISASLEEVPSGPTHRDLKTDHILFDGDRLALLDLDFFAEADPILDPARILAHLAGLTFRFDLPDDGRCKVVARAFAEEYFVHVPRTWRGRLPLHYAGAVLKEAVAVFRRQESRWPEKAAALVEEARDALAGRVW